MYYGALDVTHDLRMLCFQILEVGERCESFIGVAAGYESRLMGVVTSRESLLLCPRIFVTKIFLR